MLWIVACSLFVEKTTSILTSDRPSYKIYRTLVFPCGSGIGLEIADALGSLKEVELIGATSASKTPTHCEYVYPKVYDTLSMLSEEDELVRELANIVRDEKIDVIFPGLDDATTFLAKYRTFLESATDAVILLPPNDAVNIVRSKKLTYERLKNVSNVLVPRMFENWREGGDDLPFPLFVKPERGQGSQGARRVESFDQLVAHADAIVDPVVLEYLPGREYTVDCFADRDGGLIFARARQRRRIRGGISVATSPLLFDADSRVTDAVDEVIPAGDRDDWVEPMARSIQRTLRLHGAFFFQVKENVDGDPVLMEVAPRIAGAMALFRFSGVNLPLLTIYEAFRRPTSLLLLDYATSSYRVEVMDKAYVNRFRVHGLDAIEIVYVDLDDTLILRGKLNTKLVRLLFQYVNEGKQIVLVTRSAADPTQILESFRLRPLFDRILHVTDRSIPKSVEIVRDMNVHLSEGDSCVDDASSRAIFVDDSFRERRDVFENSGMLVFDCSMISVLLDERPNSLK